MVSKKQNTKTKEVKCHLAELMQYQCDIQKNRVVCVPFIRIFKRCQGRPTVEVTPIYDLTGNPISNGNESIFDLTD
ncbi:hypothetical protein C2G38_2094777 [Gigaspora rosea]|uniref:Uncharacterized protein n=1 Tax=Gigaspora rosea TaxID=44941 RepID=A0A397UX55_9GLOM|nr:hypothetical protein C2G38_2094777 [Gigaspora rosea]